MSGSNWGYSLLEAVALKGTLVLGAAWLVAILLRRFSAAVRHVVWTAAFAALLALPFLSLSLPAWRVRVVPSSVLFQASAAASNPAVISVPPRVGASAAPLRSSSAPPWRGVVVALWLAGVLVAVARMLAGGLAMIFARRRSRQIEQVHVPGMRRAVPVLEARPGAMPMTFGFLRPAVFLPADADSWSPGRRRMVLLHELAHIRRGDAATHLLAKAALCLSWWNPLAWHAWREFLKERERAADDLVLAAGARPSEYAGYLLEIARTMQPARALDWAAIAMARRSQIEGRLLSILDSGVNRQAPARPWMVAAVLLAVAFVSPFAALRAQEDVAVPADVEATIRTAAAEKNNEMLDKVASAAATTRRFDIAQKLLESSLLIREQKSGAQSVDYGVGLLKLGDLERRRNHRPEAEAFYTKALSVLGGRPESAPALLYLATVAIGTNRFDDAFDLLQRAQVADPSQSGRALMWMAVIRDRQSRPAEAESLYQTALAQQSENSADAMVLYAQFLRGQGRSEEAQSFQDRAQAERKAHPYQTIRLAQAAGTNAVRVGNGVTPPTLVFKAEPEYTEEARVAKYQGTVIISAEIGTDGAASMLQVVRGLGFGLDDNAIDAISRWQFKPGTKDGQPVPVMATIEVNFRLL